MTSYVTITPARDEEQLLPGVIASMATQSCPPTKWIIIDDGSSDSTADILDRATRQHPWIEVHHLPKDRPRAAGGESVIMRYLLPSIWQRYDFVLRLDADLSFDSGMTGQLIREFSRDPHLGIAGASLFEPSLEGWRESRQPSFHTRGAVKMYSRACFAAIGGLDSGLGWDTLDEARAMMHGFRTRCFRHIYARHHRPQGTADGIVRGRLAAGRAAYRIGYSPLFMLARSGRRMFQHPFVVGGAALFAGYLEGYLRRLPKAATPDVEAFIRAQQFSRLFGKQSLWR
jgi:biofilm PGA synthesis N-glycosyltransferase PgaC